MKKVIAFVIGLSSILSASAQVTQDFNVGSRNAVRANCWQMWGMNVNGGNNALEGSHGARSSQMSNANGTYEVISPWITVSPNTQASFKYSRTNSSTGSVQLQVVAVDDNGVTTTVWGPQPVNPGTQNGTFNITLTGTYQFKFEFLSGGGGNSRGLLDDISIAGTFAADITNNSNGNCALATQSAPDADGDGVPDSDDDYPNDASLAFNNFYPDASSTATIAFEDLWPSYGDYDFNDVIIDYKVNTITNSDNDAVQVIVETYVRAVGGSKGHGFGIQFDNLTDAQIQSVTGSVLAGGINISGKGLETGQSKPVVIVYETVEDVINRPGGSLYNTIPANPTGTSDTTTIVMTFTNPLAVNSFGTIPFNPFIFVDGTRSHEIHMVDKAPTDKMDMTLFGQSNDASDPASGVYYKSADNYCWGIEIPAEFDYPVERQDIVVSHLKFAQWAQSSGGSSSDWYEDKSGYRDNTNIY
ncbi:LruC domain-containing protein [Cryomorphaceae bacterium]|nr:LruC domain-containing protein [Cryomorphaceae bacterium]